MERYDKQVSEKEITKSFGPSGYEEVDGAISALFCQGGSFCSKLKIQSFSPDLPIQGDQQLTSRSGAWTSFFSRGKTTCSNDEIVTGIECSGENCGSVSLQCSPLNSKVYRRSNSSRASEEWASSSSIRTRCNNGSYMVGMQCRGNDCSQIRLECATIEYKNRKDCDDNTTGTTDNDPEPPTDKPTCRDETLNNGSPWLDIDGHSCFEYSKRGWCEKYGSRDAYRNIYTASEACCMCGGGTWN